MSPFPNGSSWGSLPELTARRRGRTRAPETWPTGSACATASRTGRLCGGSRLPTLGKASLDLRGVRLGGAGDRQGGGAHPVRHSRDRGAPDRVGPGSVLRVHQGEGRTPPSVTAGSPGGRTGQVPVLVVLRRELEVRAIRGAPRGRRGGGGQGPGAAGRDPPGDAGGGGLLRRPGQKGRRPGGA